MPEICRFLGIVIYMYYRDHPPAHFHAVYGDHEVPVGTATGAVRGRFPRWALNFAPEWRLLHNDELSANWDRAVARMPLTNIGPLE